MRILGAILAGGQSRRFGSDKAAALLEGRALIDHIFASLAPQVTEIAIVGRAWAGLTSLSDRPGGGLGPLAGLNAALRHANDSDFDAVLSVGCDTLPIPDDLLGRLSGEGPAIVAGQYLMGFWPSSLAAMLDDHLAKALDRSMRGWIEHCGARPIQVDMRFHNLNTPEDLAAYAGITPS